ncbi:Hypothetical predicted protein, partial [Olea europaea subsp. europaea]
RINGFFISIASILLTTPFNHWLRIFVAEAVGGLMWRWWCLLRNNVGWVAVVAD